MAVARPDHHGTIRRAQISIRINVILKEALYVVVGHPKFKSTGGESLIKQRFAAGEAGRGERPARRFRHRPVTKRGRGEPTPSSGSLGRVYTPFTTSTPISSVQVDPNQVSPRLMLNWPIIWMAQWFPLRPAADAGAPEAVQSTPRASDTYSALDSKGSGTSGDADARRPGPGDGDVAERLRHRGEGGIGRRGSNRRRSGAARDRGRSRATSTDRGRRDRSAIAPDGFSRKPRRRQIPTRLPCLKTRWFRRGRDWVFQQRSVREWSAEKLSRNRGSDPPNQKGLRA